MLDDGGGAEVGMLVLGSGCKYCVMVSCIIISVCITMYNTKKVLNKVMHLNHSKNILPYSHRVEKLSSVKLVPGARKDMDCCYKVGWLSMLNILSLRRLGGLQKKKCFSDLPWNSS